MEYHLCSFTDDELTDILKKEDEWSDLDVILAQRLLQERGRPVNSTDLAEIRANRHETLSSP